MPQNLNSSPFGQERSPWRDVRRLLIVRADNIGDIVMAGPALRALREALPSARLTLLASPAGAEAAALLPWLDDVIAWRVLWQDLGRLPFDPARELTLFERLRRERFDGALILTSFNQTPHPAAFAACMAGIALRAGASRERSDFLTHAISHGDDAQHQVERNLTLVEALGFPLRDRALEIAVPKSACASAAQMLAERGIRPGAGYIVFNPWASAAARTYSPLRGAEAARLIAAAAGLPVVVTAHARDAQKAAELVEHIGAAAVDLSGATSVCELAAVVSGAVLALSGNTSVMHLADALGTPALVPYSGTDLESQWTPRRAPHTLLRRPTPCSPCYALTCPYQHECLDFEPQEVADAGLDLLRFAEREGRASCTASLS